MGLDDLLRNVANEATGGLGSALTGMALGAGAVVVASKIMEKKQGGQGSYS